MDTVTQRASGLKSGLMDANLFASSVKTVTIWTKTINAKSYHKTVRKSMKLATAMNAKTITRLIGTTIVWQLLIAKMMIIAKLISG